MKPSSASWWVRARRLAPLVVVALSLLGTLTTTAYIHQSAKRRDEERFEAAVRDTGLAIQKRIETYTALLRATAGLLSGNQEVSRQDFEAYIRRLQLRERYPGTLGIGIAQRIEAHELPEFVSGMQQVHSKFEVWPESAGTMFPITYLEPLDWRNQRALGYDMFSERSRRTAMERAARTGEAAATGSVTLVQETQQDQQPGFLIYVPFYRGGVVPPSEAERQERIAGFAYSPLRVADLLDGIFEAADPFVEFVVYDSKGPQPRLALYDSDPHYTSKGPRVLRRELEMNIAGHPWVFVLSSRPSFLNRSETRFIPLVAIGGGVLTLVLFGITLTLARAWAQTERAAAQLTISRDELRELAERFRVALKNAPILVYNTDLDLRYTWVANAPVGLAADHIMGKRDDEITDAANAAPLIALKKKVLRSGAGHRQEIPFKVAGEQRYFDVTVEPLRDAAGALYGLTVAAFDITDLRNAYEKFRLASQAVRSLIYQWEVDLERVSRTEGMMDVLGIRPEEAEPTPQWWLQRIHPDDVDRYVQGTQWAMANSERYVLEYRMRHAQGHWVDVWDHGVIVRDAQGRITSVVGNAINVSEMKAAERALARHAEELQRSNTDLQDFAYIASHDLKEPLRGISNYARFLEEDQAPLLDEEGRERLQTIQRLAQHMYGLLDSLLEFSRVGRTKLAVSDVDLNHVVHDVVAGLGPWLEQEGGEVRIRGPLPMIRADRVRIGQVFSNLIANGVKYNDGPSKIVEVGATSLPDEHGPVIYIRDNGIGIHPRHQDKLFRMFKRLHPRTQYGGGTGSGLAIAKKIVERHGGRIWLESQFGKGTTFYFTLHPQDGVHHNGEAREEPARPVSQIDRESGFAARS